jgi:hypothetical protein
MDRAIVVALFFFAAACGSKRGGLEAPMGAPRGPVPLWSAVTPKSSLVIHVRLETLYDVPLFRMGIDLLQAELSEKKGVPFDDLVKEIGFDPLYDIKEVFITDLGGGLKEDYVILVRYKQEGDLLEPFARLASVFMKAANASSFRGTELRGRKAMLSDPGGFVAIQVDPSTIAVLRATSDMAQQWLVQMSKPNDNRKAIAERMALMAKDERLGGRPPCVTLYVDFVSRESFSALSGKINMVDMKKLLAQMAVERDIFLVGEVDYKDEESARKLADEIGGLFENPPPTIAFFSDLLRQIQERLVVQREGTLVKVKATIPEGVLDTVYVMLKMLLDMGKSMNEVFQPGGGGPGRGL